MSYQKQNFGMMDEGYFVPRGQLIDWINNLLHLSITKIQQLGAGSIYCQIVDVIHPGKVPMNKINWKAKNDYQFINNLKILQTAFDKAGVKRYVQVQKLAKTKYQDNLQFIQWLKRYYDLNCGDRGSSYNPQERRGNAQVDFSFADKNVVPKSFNSGGQVSSKNQLAGKKVNPIIPNKSSIMDIKVQQKVEKKEQKNEKKVESKVEQKIPKKIEVKSPTRVQNRKTQVNPKIEKQAIKFEGVKSHKDEVKGKQNGKQNTQKQNWEEKYNSQLKRSKELDLKLKMIQEVLISTQESSLKIAMLNEIVGIVIQPEEKQEEKIEKISLEVERHDIQIQASQQQPCNKGNEENYQPQNNQENHQASQDDDVL